MQSSIIIIDDDRDCVICIPQVTCFELRNWPRARSLPLAFLLPLFPILAPTSIFSSILAPTPPPSFFLRAAASLFLPFHSSKPEESSSGYFSCLRKATNLSLLLLLSSSLEMTTGAAPSWRCINTLIQCHMALFVQINWTVPCLQWRTRQHLFCFYSVPHEIWKRENGKIQ